MFISPRCVSLPFFPSPQSSAPRWCPLRFPPCRPAPRQLCCCCRALWWLGGQVRRDHSIQIKPCIFRGTKQDFFNLFFFFSFLLSHCFSLCFKEFVSEAWTAVSKFVQNWLQDQKFLGERESRNNMSVSGSFPSDRMLTQSLLPERCNTN